MKSTAEVRRMRFDDRALPFDHPALLLLGRLLIVYIFATSGIAKILSWSGNVAYMNTRHLPLVPVMLAIATVIEVGGSICLITGFYARTAAFVMFVYMIFVTVIFHAYWSSPPNVAPMQETHFRKNLAIMGGLLFVAAHGPGRWAVKTTDEPLSR
jgi:putative oxidoreductase